MPPSRPDALAATHASEHNAVYVGPQNDTHSSTMRKAREEKMRKRRTRDEELVKKGRLDKETANRGAEHEIAFLYPLPFFAPPVLGCVTASAGVVADSLSCATVSTPMYTFQRRT